MFRLVLSVTAAAMLAAPSASRAVDRDTLSALMTQPIIDMEIPLAEYQRYVEARVPPMPASESRAQWESNAVSIRRRMLEEVVFRGDTATWRAGDTKVDWFETIETGEGYRIRKLRYEALPGLWVPALLYEPTTELSGRVPIVLNLNGHHSGGKAMPYKQRRCINQAKRGMLALNLEFLGMGQLRQRGFKHNRLTQLDLCGTSGLAPFYLALKRGLDVALSLEHADPKRVGVCGMSGGGWQSIWIASLDARITLVNPVAGYGSFLVPVRHPSNVGDAEQMPTDMCTVGEYTHLTALLAPRPTLLTFNIKDDCCWRPDVTLAALVEAAQPIYELYGQTDRLRTHINEDPGTHNFDRDNREALYRMFREFFYSGSDDFETAGIVIPDEQLQSESDLNVPLPATIADFHSLAVELSRELPRNAELPDNAPDAITWQRTARIRLQKLVKMQDYDCSAHQYDTTNQDNLQVNRWRLKLGQDWTVPAIELTPANARSTTMMVCDRGRAELADFITSRIAAGERVLAVDLFGFGESATIKVEQVMLVAAMNERPLGIQAGQLAAVSRWLHGKHNGQTVKLVSVGPRSGTLSLVAAALEPTAIAGLELHQAWGTLKEVIEQNLSADDAPELFCFGLLEQFDVMQLAALMAPREVRWHQPTPRVLQELSALRQWYATFGVTYDPLRPRTAKPKTVRVAGIVLKWLRTDKEANYGRVDSMIREAAEQGAKIVCTTESFLDGYAIADRNIPLETFRALGEEIPDGPYFKRLAGLADELDIYLVAGILEADGDLRYNAAALIGPEGRLIGRYHKQILGHEVGRITGGHNSSVFDTAFGRAGVMICADRTDDNIVRRFCDNGADFLICPSGGMFGPKRNDPIVQSRSRENGKHIVFVHPAEFLVTGPAGSIVRRTVLGDRLRIEQKQVGTDKDVNRVFLFDLPLP